LCTLCPLRVTSCRSAGGWRGRISARGRRRENKLWGGQKLRGLLHFWPTKPVPMNHRKTINRVQTVRCARFELPGDCAPPRGPAPIRSSKLHADVLRSSMTDSRRGKMQAVCDTHIHLEPFSGQKTPPSGPRQCAGCMCCVLRCGRFRIPQRQKTGGRGTMNGLTTRPHAKLSEFAPPENQKSQLGTREICGENRPLQKPAEFCQ